MAGNKKLVLAVIIFAVVFGLIFVWFLFSKPGTVSNAFVGNLSHIEGDSVFISGKYLVGENSYLPEGNELIEVEIVVTSATKFKRTALLVPSQKELQKTGGMFKTDEVEKDISDANLEIFKKDASESPPIGLEAVSSKNIFNKSRFESIEISYRLAIFPNNE